MIVRAWRRLRTPTERDLTSSSRKCSSWIQPETPSPWISTGNDRGIDGHQISRAVKRKSSREISTLLQQVWKSKLEERLSFFWTKLFTHYHKKILNQFNRYLRIPMFQFSGIICSTAPGRFTVLHKREEILRFTCIVQQKLLKSPTLNKSIIDQYSLIHGTSSNTLDNEHKEAWRKVGNFQMFQSLVVWGWFS